MNKIKYAMLVAIGMLIIMELLYTIPIQIPGNWRSIAAPINVITTHPSPLPTPEPTCSPEQLQWPKSPPTQRPDDDKHHDGDPGCLAIGIELKGGDGKPPIPSGIVNLKAFPTPKPLSSSNVNSIPNGLNSHSLYLPLLMK